MSTKEKVAKFLQSRVTPVSTKYMADYFLMSKDAISRALKELENEGRIKRQRKGQKFYWAWTREEPMPVAVPAKAIKLSNTPAFNRPIQNSYPLARGYDD